MTSLVYCMLIRETRQTGRGKRRDADADMVWINYNAANHRLMGSVPNKISISNNATNYRLAVLFTKITLMIRVSEKDYLVITKFQLLFARYKRGKFT